MQHFEELPLIGILRGADTPAVEAAVSAALAGGLRTLEITLNRPEACEQIALLKARHGDELTLGAGTVVDTDGANRAVAAGAEFIVTPALVPEVVQLCLARQVPVFPGAMTPTEILAAHHAGATMVKLFPAAALGPGYLKALQGPLPQIKLIPTGGVSLPSVPLYFQAGAAAVGVGGELFKKEWMAAGDWAAIERTAAAYVKAVKKAITR